jgi:netrin 1
VVQCSSRAVHCISLMLLLQVTYVSMQFCSVRPDSMAIYKSVDYGRTWIPFQFYSSDCRRTYGRPVRGPVTRANEQEPLCTDVYSTQQSSASIGGSAAATIGGPSWDQIGSRIAFSTLEGRPSAHSFENSPVLQVNGNSRTAPE